MPEFYNIPGNLNNQLLDIQRDILSTALNVSIIEIEIQKETLLMHDLIKKENFLEQNIKILQEDITKDLNSTNIIDIVLPQIHYNLLLFDEQLNIISNNYNAMNDLYRSIIKEHMEKSKYQIEELLNFTGLSSINYNCLSSTNYNFIKELSDFANLSITNHSAETTLDFSNLLIVNDDFMAKLINSLLCESIKL